MWIEKASILDNLDEFLEHGYKHPFMDITEELILLLGTRYHIGKYESSSSQIQLLITFRFRNT